MNNFDPKNAPDQEQANDVKAAEVEQATEEKVEATEETGGEGEGALAD